MEESAISDPVLHRAALNEPVVNTYQVDVMWGDCDPAGIVHYPNYFIWMDEASHYLFSGVGLGWTSLQENFGVPGAPLVNAQADFRSPAKFGDQLTIRSYVSRCGTKSLTVTHEILAGERLVAEGRESRVWVKADPEDPAKLTPHPIPDVVREALGVAGGPV